MSAAGGEIERGSSVDPPAASLTPPNLDAERAHVTAQIAALSGDLADIVASSQLVSTDDEHDPEGSTIAFERARIEALLDQAKDHLAAIDHAEARIAAGTYGCCERCSQPIAAARLAARPTASTCIACAAR